MLTIINQLFDFIEEEKTRIDNLTFFINKNSELIKLKDSYYKKYINLEKNYNNRDLNLEF